MSGKRLLWMTGFSIFICVIEENLRDEVVLLTGLILIVVYMGWNSKIWEKLNKDQHWLKKGD